MSSPTYIYCLIKDLTLAVVELVAFPLFATALSKNKFMHLVGLNV